ncbi:hypothetical protein DFH09DRAFT_1404607 [Mycena vulgaris]|nr:hypothetical protein DFH09DRAFT_1404607 [Mycena vulgaris]
MDGAASLGVCPAFVQSLKFKKIQDWWAHKQSNEWIIPCLVKSQSLIPADVWDITPSTTNLNEAQHTWTKSLTGTKLILVEAIETAFVVDKNVADEIQTSTHSGILTNAHNEVVHRIQASERQQLDVQLAEELEARCESTAHTKELTAQLKLVKSSSKKSRSSSSSALLSASSSGRVKSAGREFLFIVLNLLSLTIIPPTTSSEPHRKAATATTVIDDVSDDEIQLPESNSTENMPPAPAVPSVTGSRSDTVAAPLNGLSLPEELEPAVSKPHGSDVSHMASTEWDSLFSAPAITIDVVAIQSTPFTMPNFDFNEPAATDFLNPRFHCGMPTFPNVADPVAPAYDFEMAQLNALFGFDPSLNGAFDATSPDLPFTSSSSESQYQTPSDFSFNFFLGPSSLCLDRILLGVLPRRPPNRWRLLWPPRRYAA